MWLLVIIGLVLGGWAVFQLGLIPPANAETIIHIRAGAVIVGKGQLLSHARTSLGEILRETEIRSGFIAIVPGPSVKFSRSIPTALHQRLRNVLLNQ